MELYHKGIGVGRDGLFAVILQHRNEVDVVRAAISEHYANHFADNAGLPQEEMSFFRKFSDGLRAETEKKRPRPVTRELEEEELKMLGNVLFLFATNTLEAQQVIARQAMRRYEVFDTLEERAALGKQARVLGAAIETALAVDSLGGEIDAFLRDNS